MEKGGYSLAGVASRSAASSGGTGIERRMVSAGGDAFWVEGGLRSFGMVGTFSRVHMLH